MALRLVAAVVGGLGSSDRNLTALHTDALKAADKCLRDKAVSAANKCAAGAVIKAVAEAGGSGLWANAGSGFDDIVGTCVTALTDPSLSVREMFAAALGEIAAASNAPAAKDAVSYPVLQYGMWYILVAHTDDTPPQRILVHLFVKEASHKGVVLVSVPGAHPVQELTRHMHMHMHG